MGFLCCVLVSIALPPSCRSFVLPRPQFVSLQDHARVSTKRHTTAADASGTAVAPSTPTQSHTSHEDHIHHGLQPSYDAKTYTQMRKYEAEHARSVADPSAFWKSKAEHFLDWEQPFQSVMEGSLTDGDVTWFQGGKLNVCYNAIDRHVQKGRADQVAMIWEGDEPGDVLRFTYRDLQRKVSQIANALLAQGVQRGDVVTVYLPMIPELPMTMLACARIGAVHSVVFAGFSAEALASRISAAESPYVVTAWEGMRGGRSIPLKKIVDEARTKEGSDHFIRKIFVFERNYSGDGNAAKFELKDKDVRMDPLVALQRPYCPPATMDAEDSLFILYTSGSTGTYANATTACAAVRFLSGSVSLVTGRPAQGASPYDGRVCAVCGVYHKNHLRFNEGRRLCVRRRLWMDHRPLVRSVRSPPERWHHLRLRVNAALP